MAVPSIIQGLSDIDTEMHLPWMPIALGQHHHIEKGMGFSNNKTTLGKKMPHTYPDQGIHMYRGSFNYRKVYWLSKILLSLKAARSIEKETVWFQALNPRIWTMDYGWL